MPVDPSASTPGALFTKHLKPKICLNETYENRRLKMFSKMGTKCVQTKRDLTRLLGCTGCSMLSAYVSPYLSGYKADD